VKQAELSSEAETIKSMAGLEQKKASQAAALAHQHALDDLEITKAKDLAEIEAEKFKSIVDAIGPDTLATIAQAGPEMQTKLLSGLGLKSFLLTDSNSPLNIFNQ
jgi:major vault protein